MLLEEGVCYDQCILLGLVIYLLIVAVKISTLEVGLVNDKYLINSCSIKESMHELVYSESILLLFLYVICNHISVYKHIHFNFYYDRVNYRVSLLVSVQLKRLNF